MFDLKFAETYDRFRKPESEFHRQKYKKFFEVIGKNKNHKVLELGCGTGIYTKFLKGDFNQVIATDVDPKMIKITKNKLKCEVCIANSLELPIKNNSIDLVIGISVLHHIKNRSKVIREVKRVLKQNSYFVFCEPNRLNPLTFLFQSILGEDSISRYEIKEMVKEHGLDSIITKEILLTPNFYDLTSKQPKFCSIIEKVFEKLHLGVTLLLIGKKR